MELERSIEMEPAYNRFYPNPLYEFGNHGVDIVMRLKGDDGVVCVTIFTNWMLPDGKGYEPTIHGPIFHAKHPTREYTSEEVSCKLLGGGYCYSGGANWQSDKLLGVLLYEGSDGLWRELEAFYHEVFDTDGPPAIDTERLLEMI